MPRLTTRRRFALGAIICAVLLGVGYFLQFARDIEPCPLCILQRLAFFAIGVACLAGVASGIARSGARLLFALIALFAALGGSVAARQVWLQSLPAERVPACGPGLEYMLGAFPLSKTLSMVLRGSGECAENSWQFLGLGMAAWALIWFVLLGAVAARSALEHSR